VSFYVQKFWTDMYIVTKRYIIREIFYTNNQSCALNSGLQNFSDLVQEEFSNWGSN